MRCSCSLDVPPIGRGRRFALVALAVALAAILFRSDVALALVNRGDDELRAGDATAARRYYARAAFFTPSWDVPADRFAFSAAISGDPQVLRAGIRIATRSLAWRDSAALRWDRAMCLLHMGRASEALVDLAALARARRADWRMNDMARNLALHLGRLDLAHDFAPWARPHP